MCFVLFSLGVSFCFTAVLSLFRRHPYRRLNNNLGAGETVVGSGFMTVICEKCGAEGIWLGWEGREFISLAWE